MRLPQPRRASSADCRAVGERSSGEPNGAVLCYSSGMQTMLEPISPAVGVVASGFDLRSNRGDDVRSHLEELVDQYHVVALPDQTLPPDVHVEVGRWFGEPLIHPYLTAIDGHPEILRVHKEPDDEATFGGEFWHADITFMAPPASVSLLQSLVLPPVGGDTLFANQHLALDALSPAFRATLEGLRAVHLYPGMSEDATGAMAVHPVVRRHPRTGRDALFVNPAFVQRFEGMTVAESRPLLQQLFEHQVRPEFTCRARWSPGMLLLWDNRAVLHYAMNDYFGHERTLQRVTSMERTESP